MKRTVQIFISASILLVAALSVTAQGTAFTYQGRLNERGGPANGNYDLQFTIYDQETRGRVIGPTLAMPQTPVSDGLFMVTLDFHDNVFTGDGRWLEISVSAETLSPRQRLTATPYAVTAGNLTGVVPSGSISGTYANAVTFNHSANTFAGTFSGNGAGLTELNASNLAGGTVGDARLSSNVALRNANNNFTGINALNDLDLRLRADNDANHGLGWYGPGKLFGNVGLNGPALFGLRGGFLGTTEGSPKSVLSWNQAGQVGIGTTFPTSTLHVYGGIRARGGAPGLLGVNNNGYAFDPSNGDADTGLFCSVPGQLDLYTDAQLRLKITPDYVGIGTTNPATHLHLYSTAITTTLRLQSSHAPGFGRIEFQSNPQGDPNEWRPAYIQSGDLGGFTGVLAFGVNGTGVGSKFGNIEVMRIVNGRVGIGTGVPGWPLEVSGTATATTFNEVSDRNRKENFTPINPRDVLDRLAALPITRWNFKGDAAAPHLGPMAQDFQAAFGLGADDKHIATVDADGVALAAIQGLNQKLEEKDARIGELERRLAALQIMIKQQSGKGD